jgi:cyanate permease
MGAQWSLAAVAAAVMPALAGVVRDRAGGYAPALVGVAVLFALAAAAALLSDRRRDGEPTGFESR